MSLLSGLMEKVTAGALQRLPMQERLILDESLIEGFGNGGITQVRLPILPQPSGYEVTRDVCGLWEWLGEDEDPLNDPRYCPYDGMTFWLAETWRVIETKEDKSIPYIKVEYRQDREVSNWIPFEVKSDDDDPRRWRSSCTMPVDCCRYARIVKSVIPKRVQDLTWDDLQAEGFSSVVPYKECWDRWRYPVYYENPWTWVCTLEGGTR